LQNGGSNVRLQHIVFPTDGSPESAKPLSLAAQLATAHDAEVTVVRVVEPPSATLTGGAPGVSADAYAEVVHELERQAKSDLEPLAAQLRAGGVRARTVMRNGSADAELLVYLAEAQPDLVVMATHGYGGLARAALGSVTDRLVREGKTPLLVMRRSSESGRPLRRALVLLDGSPLAEQVIPLAQTLAGRPLQQLILFRTVADPDERQAATTYVETVQARLADHETHTEVRIALGEPRLNIERAAHDVDLVMLCTHGRGGWSRLRHGSIAAFVMREVDRPALLVRATALPPSEV
jgi:nucleotide-binding universal stress UspA family protein